MIIGPLLLIVALFCSIFGTLIWFEENFRAPIARFLDSLAIDLCCKDETVPREVGQRIAYGVAQLAYHLPLYRADVLEHAIPFIARFDDGYFFPLNIWEREEEVVLKAVTQAMARVGYIESCYTDQQPIISLLRAFAYGRMTLRKVLYSHPSYASSRAPA